MHGLIFLQLQRFVQQQAGPKAWDLLLQQANLPRKSYAPVRDYPDAEATALVAAASMALNQPPAVILDAFGAFLAPQLLRLYHLLIQPSWKTLDVIENTEAIIHAAVRKTNPGARPPVLDCVRTSEHELQLMYSSDRQMCSLAKGIIKGLAAHFGEEVTLTDHSCMQRGDAFCSLQITQAVAEHTSMESISATTLNVPLDGLRLPAAFAAAPRRDPYPFLKPPQLSDELGRIGNFRVLQRLGQGGVGIVFRAEDARLGRPVALKVLQPRFAQDETVRQRFLREARALAAVRSDYVVTVYEVGMDDQTPFLAMEYLEGETLDAYRKRSGPLPLPLVARIGRQVALGLAAAHARGLVHRDIKPANLWVEFRGEPAFSSGGWRVKILDFGLVQGHGDSGRLSQPGLVVGTPAFMAPEQARGQPVDPRTDLFSLGCVLYWLCTGELPFKGPDVLSILAALAAHDPPPPETLTTTVPSSVSELVMRLLRKDPAERLPNGQAVADFLLPVERGQLPLSFPARSG